MDAALEMKLQQLLQKSRRIILLLLGQVTDVFLSETQFTDVLSDPLQACEHSKAVPEGKLAEIGFEYSLAFMASIYPVGVHHINLIFVRM